MSINPMLISNYSKLSDINKALDRILHAVSNKSVDIVDTDLGVKLSGRAETKWLCRRDKNVLFAIDQFIQYPRIHISTNTIWTVITTQSVDILWIFVDIHK